MLIGQYEHTIDSKKRLALPAKFRGELGDKVVITPGVDNCLTVFTEKQWQLESEKISRLPIGQAEARSYTRVMLAGAMESALDKLGRILIPDYLKKYAGLNKDVVICGLSNRVEIWDKAAWDGYKQKAEKDVADIVSKLGPLGI